ncbi:hypothetical protein AS359_12575 [Comamonas kerstersii]|uniref:histidine kinase n=1 Tax=Comamonas kerstersii TaxID=225992 RepID=A0A0W7YYA7_9BURK|nr:ATP-binding protein [Comamonas kerstersii]KUF40117.1 hypothetical protein AS359_12575 [Comamonas kerstersii]
MRAVSVSHMRQGTLLACIGLAMLLIAWWDTYMEQAVAAAVLYIMVILVALRWLSARSVVTVTLVAVVLTVLSYAWSAGVASEAGWQVTEAGWINACISVLAIVITAYLGLRMQQARAAEHAARERLGRLTRMGNLGALGAAIAHEVNQPLSAIVTSGNACQRWLNRQPPQLERAHQALQRMLDQAERASNVINRVRGMARGEAPTLEAVDLDAVVQEMLPLIQARLAERHMQVRWTPPVALPHVWADKLQLQQVLGNLLLNAADAVEEAVHHWTVPSDPIAVQVSAAVLPAQQVQLTVQDCGVGLPAAIAEHVFDAFWSTKPQGMGLGLSLCRSMVESMGGRIWAQPRNDGTTGAMFFITLPLAYTEHAIAQSF